MLLHNNTLAPVDLKASAVDLGALPCNAFADEAERRYPHHCVKAGVMYLHRDLLLLAWREAHRVDAKAQGGVVAHLVAHVKTIDVGEYDAIADMELRAALSEEGAACTLAAEARFDLVAAAAGEAPRRPTFEIVAYNGGPLKVGFGRPIVIDCAGIRANRVTVLKGHDPNQIVGQGTAKIDQAKGIIAVSGIITGDYKNPDTPAGDVVSHAHNGFIWAASVGVGIDSMEWVDAGQKASANGQEFAGPVGIARKSRLGETSFVGIGADENATAQIAASSRH